MAKQQRRIRPASRFWIRRRGQQTIAVIPTLLTLGNAVCGFGSITYAARVGPEVAASNDLYFAALLIFVAMIFDALDGPVARLSSQTSDFGAQLDSLSDAISFGVAPAFLMLRVSYVFHPRVLWVIALLYVLSVLLRLARFNLHNDTDEYKHPFCGLPSPAAAGMVASLVIVAPGHGGVASLLESHWLVESLTSATTTFVPVAALIAAFLMISRVPYQRDVSQFVSGRVRYRRLVKFVFLLVVVAAFHELAMPLVFIWYVASPVLRALFSRMLRMRATLEAGDEATNGSDADDAYT